MLRDARGREAGGLRRVRARRGLRRVLAEVTGRLRRGQGRVGAQRHQDLDHQRRHRQHARARALGRPRRSGSRGQASFVVPEGTPGISQGQKFKKMGIRASHTAEVVLDDCRVPGRCLLGGKEKLDERLARAKEGQEDVDAGRHGHLRGVPPDRRRAGRRHRPGGLRVLARLRQGAQAVRPGHHREPGHRLQAGRHEDAHGRRPSAGAPCGEHGRRPARSSRTARARCPSSTPARTRCG